VAREHVEIERKFDVEEGFTLPSLADVPGVASVADPVEHTLEAAYHDTADLRLARARVTLRRRTGGTDAGWHVKLPASAGARRELRSPLGRATRTVPKAVLTPLLGIVRTAPVLPVATLSTRRLVTELLGDDGRVLAEVADDHVTGTALPAEPGEAALVTSWREVEVELVDGDEELLTAVGDALTAAGAVPSVSASKLSRVLADRLDAGTAPAVAAGRPVVPGVPATDEDDDDGEPVGTPDAPGQGDEPTGTGTGGKKGKGGRKGKGGKGGAAKGAGSGADGAEPVSGKERRRRERVATATAGEVARAALADLVAGLQTADLMVRTDAPDGVHQVRVSCRRLRSVLAAFRRVLDRERTDPVRAELQWAGAQLSGSRDAEVAVGHLRELVAAQPVELVLGPVAARLQQEELRDGLAGGDEARRALGTPRYLELLDALAGLVADPPFTEHAAEPAVPVVQGVLAHTVTRLRRAVEVAQGTEDPEALHEVRKAAKRLRYTADVAVPVLGAPVKDLVTALKDVQEVLGQRQDTFVTRPLCTRLGLEAFAAGENAWTYGRLHALEEARGAEAEREFWVRWPTLRSVLKVATR
jgi:CHAD domain-containing protein